MTEPPASPLAVGDLPTPPDWEAFYRDYRKPGYIEGFEITTKLGGGMFGLVFRARRMSIGKDYAIKFLKVDDAEVRGAVLSELSQVNWFAQIDHPNLVAIEDRGEVDGIPYLVMAFAGSETLRDRMPVDQDGHGVAPNAQQKHELLSCFLQCCRGLQALHERGLVHFDLKPANVFLKGSVARLGDYGLSKLVTHSRGSLSMGRGTPYYMAPEMLQRRGDHRSDIYSLGIVLYELLCGCVPFRGDSEWAVLKQHETKVPDWPPQLTSIERAVLQRCLAKDPAARFQSVQDLIVAMGGSIGVGAAAAAQPFAGAHSVGAARAPAARVEPPPLPTTPSTATPRAAAASPSRPWPIGDWNLKAVQNTAREAGRQAGKIAKRAAQEARRASRHASRKAREHGKRVAKQVSSEMRHRLRQARPFVWGVGALLACLLLLGLFMMAAAPHSMEASVGQGWPVAEVAAAPSAPAVPAAASRPTTVGLSPATSSLPLFDTYVVPAEFHDLVSTAEPRWAQLAARDSTQAKQLLLEHIDRLRQRTPASPDARLRTAALPSFSTRTAPSPQVSQWIAQLLAARRYDANLAARIVARGPEGLGAAAQAMVDLAWSDEQDLERARRLQRLLQEATSCRDIVLVDRAKSLAELAAANRQVGALWRWFVNEFACTERAWQAYRSLLNLSR